MSDAAEEPATESPDPDAVALKKTVALLADTNHGNALKFEPGVVFRRADTSRPIWWVFWGGQIVDVVNAHAIESAGEFFWYIERLTDPDLDGGIPENRRVDR